MRPQYFIKKIPNKMKKQTLIYICLTLSIFTPTFGQKCDELERLIANCANDTNKVNLLWRWAGCYTGNNPDSVVILCKKGELLARELNFTEGVFKCLARPTASLYRLGKSEEAEKNIKEGRQFAIQLKDTFNILRFMDAYATFKLSQNESQEAIKICQEGLRISWATGETYRRPMFYLNMGNAYCSLGDAKKSIEASFQGLPYSEKAGDKGELAGFYINIAINMNNSQLDLEGRAKYARLALENALAVNKKFQVMAAQSILGEYYLTQKKDSVTSIQYIEQALKTAQQMNMKAQITQYFSLIGFYKNKAKSLNYNFT